MSEYPKIHTLYVRDEKTHKVIPDQIRFPEFENIKSWYITEKIDGTNVRVFYNPVRNTVRFGGRTNNAQMQTTLVENLQKTFTVEKLSEVFKKDEYVSDRDDFEVILYGEGYGEKIQKGGGNYRKDVSFRLFDVRIGEWWLEIDNMAEISRRIGIETVPLMGYMRQLPDCIDELQAFCPNSLVALNENGKDDVQMEGIVARTVPLLLFRNGQRLMWKLKFKDFA